MATLERQLDEKVTELTESMSRLTDVEEELEVKSSQLIKLKQVGYNKTTCPRAQDLRSRQC